ncbi:aminotransferase [Lichenibacterium dinghuense]|uniref:aminotransferase n=1 Tax=Lichenibacterium dinghuense TaxID=2895977 RepID=UPI001EFFEDE1|nr:aminotransferase [Lichenibacterium sp. 6Y81]
MRINPLVAATAPPPVPAAALWRAAYDGRHGPLVDLAQAVPGVPPPDALLQRMAAAAGDPAHAGYGPITGEPALRAALAADVSALYGAAVAPDEVAITSGCNEAFAVAMMAVAGRGEEAIVPTPWYFSHKMALDIQGIVAVPLFCRAADGFVPSVAAARALIGPATRAIVLVSPNNPTGAIYPPEVLAGFLALAREAGIALVLDETYRDFLPGGARPHGLFRDPNWRDALIHLYSFSKSYAVPGHRLGAAVAGRPLLAEVAKVLDCVTICPPRAAQAAVAWAVEGTRGWRTGTRDAVARRAALFAAAVAAAPGWSVSAIGAYFAYVRHPLGGSAEAAAERLCAEAGLLALPGSFFGPGQEDHLRFAYPNLGDDAVAGLAERLAILGGAR